MPNIKSAKKRVRQSEKIAERNKHVMTKIKSEIKRVTKLDAEQVKDEVGPLHSRIARARKAGVIEKGKENRLKGRVSRLALK